MVWCGIDLSEIIFFLIFFEIFKVDNKFWFIKVSVVNEIVEVLMNE